MTIHRVTGVAEWVFARVRQAYAPTHLPESVRLPLELDPIIRAYPHHAYLFGIMGKDYLRDGAVLNNYINFGYHGRGSVKWGASGWHLDFVPYYGTSDYFDPGFIEIKRWDPQICVRSRRSCLAEAVVNALHEGKYVEAFINKYFIRGTDAYCKTHFRHQLLIYGFDSTSKQLICATYKEDGSYGMVTVPMEFVIAGIRSRCGRIPDHWLSTDEIKEIGRPKLKLPVRWPHIASQMADFLRSDETIHPLEPQGGFRKEPGIFGIEACSCFVEDIMHALSAGLPIDLRATRLVWEAQRLMHLRTCHFMVGHENRPGITTSSEALTKDFHALHIMCLAQNARKLRKTEAGGICAAYSALFSRLSAHWGELRDAFGSV